MRITSAVIKQFESDQKNYGTRVALINILWLSATAMLKDLGINRVRTSWKKEK